YLSGLYRPSADGGDMEFVILTRSAAPDIEFIHTRMPVILDERRAREWLDLNNDPMRIIHDAYTNVKYAKAN
ncbi:MAG: SOS response-associated peptidase family protein, partial [Clostridia bacterium]|nr:SOS response-associated peptidase family protein [Clostridia bacterium]